VAGLKIVICQQKLQVLSVKSEHMLHAQFLPKFLEKFSSTQFAEVSSCRKINPDTSNETGH
jgi:hypothetical protein